MAVYCDIKEYKSAEDGCAVALGFFDGVHLGHRSVIKHCKETGLRSAAMTFSESPAKLLGRACPPLLTDNARKAELLSQAGADDVIFADFGGMKDMSAYEFVRDILHERLGAKAVCCGMNYRFGKNGEGGTDALRGICGDFGIKVIVAEPVKTDDGIEISSTRIRGMIAEGELRQANSMLGYRYSVSGDIEDGNHLGRSMGYPTVNIPIADGLAVPRYGVYASRIITDGGEYIGATNIGVHPTAGANDKPLCETFILGYGGESLYGRHVVCELWGFVRDEKRFDSFDELRMQISVDIEQIKDMMKGGA